MTARPKPPHTAVPTFAFTPIARPELYDRLDTALSAARAATLLITAPAGTGKTVLVADWLRHRRRQAPPAAAISWLTLTRRNAGAVGLRTALPGPDLPPVLVIDNAHLITEPPALAYLEYVLTHLPSSTVAILMARFAPPLRWHAAESAGLVTYLGSADLMFSSAQAKQLCAQQHCTLTADELKTVMDLTRGWPTLLRITAGQLAAEPDRRTALAALASAPRALGEFLRTEFIEGLAEPVRRFVVETSVPETFTAALAEQLTGLDAPQILDELLRVNFPLTPVAHRGELWFSYHPMLRSELLLEARYSATHAEVLRRTADWYCAMNLPIAALPHVLAGTPAELVRFLRETALRIVLDGAGPQLFQRLERAPLPADDPFLWVLRAIDALERDDVTAALTHLDIACARTPDTETIAPRGWLVPLTLAATVRAAVAGGTGLAEIRLPDPLPVTGQPDIDAYVAIEAGTALLVRGSHTLARQQLRRGLALAKCVGNHALVVRACAHLALVAGVRGGIAVARDTARTAVRSAHTKHLIDSPAAAVASAVSSFAGYLRGEPGTTPEPRQAPRCCVEPVTRLCEFDTAADKYAAAEPLRASTLRLLRHPYAAPVAGLLLPPVICALLLVTDVGAVRPLIEQAEPLLGDDAGRTVARAAVAARTGHPKTVLGLVEPIIADGDATHPLHTVTALLFTASAHAALRNPLPARAALEAALRGAEDDHLVRPFLDVPGCVQLLDTHIGTLGRYNRLAQEIRQHPAVRRGAAQPRLTATERTVLAQLPSGRTVQQIAETLGVSINTVKTHLRGIYTKLGTNSRAETLLLAHRTGLL
ncbi:AAA family ATPase [Nocardia brasiliensis]|uniref:AAA family ATPase n=1 Tax=Nocardia brasiliensis TaxID=37326 RepID=A0A6G9XSF4_NOCBR|nr:LuxR C-terminal-related transcriptional regulator [Nocardia brasiliensis]QIS03854.1 AAA family ATPase [Nocardia brasiliensis]